MNEVEQLRHPVLERLQADRWQPVGDRLTLNTAETRRLAAILDMTSTRHPRCGRRWPIGPRPTRRFCAGHPPAEPCHCVLNRFTAVIVRYWRGFRIATRRWWNT